MSVTNIALQWIAGDKARRSHQSWEMSVAWNWPDSRWWRVDLHTHSPASYDFKPETDRLARDWAAWVGACRSAGLHAVAVTDHNTPDGIQGIQDALGGTSDFSLFPGVEVTVGGIHLLCLLDPQCGRDEIVSLLSKLGIEPSAFGAQTTSSTEGLQWSNTREVLYDRLEGSRRSIRGRAVELVIRTALAEAVQLYYESNRNYGLYRSVEIPEKQIQLGSETFDVSVKLIKSNGKYIYLLVPVKSRETEGVGHSHIFTRDINSAIDASKKDYDNFVAVFIIAQNWAQREQEHVASICDLAIVISSNPNSFEDLPVSSREKFQQFVGTYSLAILNRKSGMRFEAGFSQPEFHFG